MQEIRGEIMEEQNFYISEVSRQVGVEPHVLRYWEEELGLLIDRNSQGKRCYSRENVEIFLEVKGLREKGMQLKAAREILREGGRYPNAWIAAASDQEIPFPEHPEYSVLPVRQPQDSMQVFEQLLDGIIERALEKNNEKLIKELSDLLLTELEAKWQAAEAREELERELFGQGARESAAAEPDRKASLWKRWRRWLERYI